MALPGARFGYICRQMAQRSGALERFEWEILPPQPSLGAHVQVALEEVLLDQVIAGERGATLRFWEWAEPALVLGSHQMLANEIDVLAADELGFTVCRRLSGGGTMLVEPARSITYTLVAPDALVQGLSFVDSYALLDGWVVDCLRSLGVPAGYRPINDIVSPEGKIGGAAQARRRRTVLHHTAIAYDLDPDLVPRLIRIGRDRVSEKGVRSAVKRVSPLRVWTALSRDEVVSRLLAWFSRLVTTRPMRLDAGTLDRAQTLAREKYATAGWIDRLR
jgi:lipoate---protein ligase